MLVGKTNFETRTNFWGKEPVLMEVPEEITLYILSLLPFMDISSCLAVNRGWRQLAGDESVWRKLCSNAGIEYTNRTKAREDLKVHLYRQYHLSHSPLPPTYTTSATKFGEVSPTSRLLGNHYVFWDNTPKFARIVDVRKLEEAFTVEWKTNGFFGWHREVVRLGDSHLILSAWNECKIVDLEAKLVLKKRECDREIIELKYQNNAIYLIMHNKVEKWDWEEDRITTIYENKNEQDIFPGELVEISKEILFVTNHNKLGVHKIFDLKNLLEIPNPENKFHLSVNGLLVHQPESTLHFFTHPNSPPIASIDVKEMVSVVGFIFMRDRYFVYLSDPENPKVVILDTLTEKKTICEFSHPLELMWNIAFYKSKLDLFLVDKERRIYLINYVEGHLSLLTEPCLGDRVSVDFDDWGIYRHDYPTPEWHVWDLEAPVSAEELKKK